MKKILLAIIAISGITGCSAAAPSRVPVDSGTQGLAVTRGEDGTLVMAKTFQGCGISIVPGQYLESDRYSDGSRCFAVRVSMTRADGVKTAHCTPDKAAPILKVCTREGATPWIEDPAPFAGPYEITQGESNMRFASVEITAERLADRRAAPTAKNSAGDKLKSLFCSPLTGGCGFAN